MLHEKVRDALLANADVTSLVGERIYPSIAPQSVTYPCILYRQVSRFYKSDTLGRDSMEHARFQIDCYSPTFTQTMEICAAVREAMDLKACELNYFEDYESETELYRIALDFSVFEDQI
jgi:hypothetical protein